MKKVYSIFDPPPPVSIKEFPEPGADQSFAKEADINTIMARYQKTGFIGDPTQRATRMPFWEDVSHVPTDLMEAEAAIAKSKAAFMNLPAMLRNMFQNSPHALLAWLDKPENEGQAIQWGLLPPRPPVGESVGTTQEGTSR